MKGVSTLVATVILLIITIVGGMIIYNYVMNSLTAAKQYGTLTVVAAKMTILGDNAVLNVKVANIGTAPVEIRSVELLPGNGPLNLSSPLLVEPGATKSINIDVGGRLDPNTKYYVVVKYDAGETEPYPVEVVG